MTESELISRLQHLERDNQRLKRLGGAAVFVVAVGCAIYAASCSFARTGRSAETVSGKITAHELDIVDRAGKVRVKIAVDCAIPSHCWPGVWLFDVNGKSLTTMGAGVLTISGSKGHTTLLDSTLQIVSSPKGLFPGAMAQLAVGLLNPGGSLSLSGKGGMSVMLQSDGNSPGKEGATLALYGEGGSSSSIFADANGPTLEIEDAKGYFTEIGNTDLTTPRTGTRYQTSAASITMFGNDKKHRVIWRAP